VNETFIIFLPAGVSSVLEKLLQGVCKMKNTWAKWRLLYKISPANIILLRAKLNKVKQAFYLGNLVVDRVVLNSTLLSGILNEFVPLN